MPYPTGLSLSDDGRTLEIAWSEGPRRSYGVKELRDACPCATCREKRTAAQSASEPLFKVLTPEETQPLRIDGMRPVGNYAYSIAYSDGHDTGIYTLELLQQLGRPGE
jgi:DUF971 family protein